MKYYSAGNGLDGMLVLPGSLGSSQAMAHFFSQSFPEKKIIIPEYFIADTVEKYLDGIDDILRWGGVRTPVVYGASFGGLLAQCWVRRHPEQVTHLILSGAAFPDPSRVKKNRKVLRILPVLPESLIRFALRILLQLMLRTSTDQQKMWKSEYVHLISEMTMKDIASRYQVAIDFDQNYHFAASDLADWPGKILILEGSEDRIAGEKIREGLRNLYPGAQIHTFQDAGHSVMLTHPEAWAKVVSEFMKTNASKAALS
jgi:pimeloyl-ACP methyl ester carboxylesterase